MDWIGDRRVLAGVAARLPAAHVVDLAAGVALIPLTRAVLGQLASPGDPDDQPPVPGLDALSEGLARLVAHCSTVGSLLYVKAEFFGGTGWQAAVAWRDGTISSGPILTQHAGEGRQDDGFVVVAELHDWAINVGLRHLGVRQAPDAVDEFETVGLGRHRRTDQWAHDQ